MMFDYLMACANDNDLKKEGVVAFIGADDKAFCSDQSIILSSEERKKGCKDIGNDGVREKGGSEEGVTEKQTEKFQDDGECFSWKGSLVWNRHSNSSGCTKWDEGKNKVDVGQMYGLSKDAKGFKKLKGISRLNQKLPKYHFLFVKNFSEGRDGPSTTS